MTAGETGPQEATAAGRIADLLKLTSRLIDVLEREVEMLRKMRPSEMQALQEDKIVLAAAYESQVTALKEHPELLAELNPGLRAELARAGERFQATLAENERALRAARQATEGLLKTVVEALEQRDAPAAYGAAGTGEGAPRPAMALAVNRRL